MESNLCYNYYSSYGSPSYYSPPSSSNDYSEEEDIYDDDYDESTEGPSVIDPWSGLTEVININIVAIVQSTVSDLLKDSNLLGLE